jgi:hypothetical protein
MITVNTILTPTEVLSGLHFIETFNELDKRSQKEVMRWIGLIRSGMATPNGYDATMKMLLSVFQPRYTKLSRREVRIHTGSNPTDPL